MQFFEDLYELGRSPKFMARVESGDSVLNTQNRRQGVRSRRGDGSFGEILPKTQPIADAGYVVKRGPIATIEVGIEVKILMKAMIKQIDRVTTVLRGQSQHFQKGGAKTISVGIVGINQAPITTSYEGARAFRTDGKVHKHPISEAEEAERRLLRDAAPAYDEFLVLHFAASNEAPFVFSWVNERNTLDNYGAALARVSRQYEQLM